MCQLGPTALTPCWPYAVPIDLYRPYTSAGSDSGGQHGCTLRPTGESSVAACTRFRLSSPVSVCQRLSARCFTGVRDINDVRINADQRRLTCKPVLCGNRQSSCTCAVTAAACLRIPNCPLRVPKARLRGHSHHCGAAKVTQPRARNAAVAFILTN